MKHVVMSNHLILASFSFLKNNSLKMMKMIGCKKLIPEREKRRTTFFRLIIFHNFLLKMEIMFSTFYWWRGWWKVWKIWKKCSRSSIFIELFIIFSFWKRRNKKREKHPVHPYLQVIRKSGSFVNSFPKRRQVFSGWWERRKWVRAMMVH